MEDNLHRLDLGLIEIPDKANVVGFLIGDWSVDEPRRPSTNVRQVDIKQAWKLFKKALPVGSLEETTIKGMDIHVRHLSRILKATTLREIDKPKLQNYVDKRSKDKGRYGRTLSVQTIKKELRTASTIWNWAKENDLVGEAFPNRRLRYPKYDDKPPFQTRQEIQSRIDRGGLSKHEIRELWDSLFLSVDEVETVLTFVKEGSYPAVFYPMLCIAAYTGARRSEILRSQIEDIDFKIGIITIREKKRVKGRNSTRRVPMQGKLKKVLSDWIKEKHPGTNYTFSSIRFTECVNADCATEIARDQAAHMFSDAFEGTEWDILHGRHVFRHSFCNNCAAAGIEQRVINQWVGHQTEEMVRRYRHLFPNREQEELQKVFG